MDILAIGLSIFLLFIPTLIGIIRKIPNKVSLSLLNFSSLILLGYLNVINRMYDGLDLSVDLDWWLNYTFVSWIMSLVWSTFDKK